MMIGELHADRTPRQTREEIIRVNKLIRNMGTRPDWVREIERVQIRQSTMAYLEWIAMGRPR